MFRLRLTAPLRMTQRNDTYPRILWQGGNLPPCHYAFFLERTAMKEIDRRGRISLRLMIVGIFGTIDVLFLVLILTSEPVTDPLALYYGIAAIFNLSYTLGTVFKNIFLEK